MIKKIKLKNFRSIENAEIEIAPLTIFYGPAGSGKSSVLYSLVVLKNFVSNPAQKSDGFFDLGFTNLGGFKECVFNHERERRIEIHFSLDFPNEYGISLGETSADIFLNSPFVRMQANVSIPYYMTGIFTFRIEHLGETFEAKWNGITSTVSPEKQTAENQQKAVEISKELNQIPEYLKRIDIAPHRRGFFKPSYSPSPITPNPVFEDELSTIIMNDPDIEAKVSLDLEKMLGKEFRTRILPGTAVAVFHVTDKLSRTTTLLVNEGYGVNQIVYMLAKIHRPEIKTILIEEPEVHLHPSAICALVRTFCSIVKEEGKQLILTTHSETFVSSVLTAVRRKELTPQDVKCYLVEKEQKATLFREQRVTEDGQIEGGLSSFIEAELEDLKVFFEKA